MSTITISPSEQPTVWHLAITRYLPAFGVLDLAYAAAAVAYSSARDALAAGVNDPLYPAEKGARRVVLSADGVTTIEVVAADDDV